MPTSHTSTEQATMLNLCCCCASTVFEIPYLEGEILCSIVVILGGLGIGDGHVFMPNHLAP
jgi:hypothetical protein